MEFLGEGNYCEGYEGQGRHRNVGRPRKQNAYKYAKRHGLSTSKYHKPKKSFVYLADLQNIARKNRVRGFTVMGKRALHDVLRQMGLVH
jgi:hypothetical protein